MLFVLHGREGAVRYALIDTGRDWLLHRTKDQPRRVTGGRCGYAHTRPSDERARMPTPMDPTSTGFLFAENRSQPMHVGGLQLFHKPEGAGRKLRQGHVRGDARPRRPRAAVPQAPAPVGCRTAGQWFWAEDDQFDIEYHVRHSALPKPGRVRELLELCGRLHSTRLALERPLWEAHVIEGLRDGRVAMYTKIHHALVDGVSAMRLLQSVLSHRPRRARHAAPSGPREHVAARRARGARAPQHGSGRTCRLGALRPALGDQRRGGRPARRAGQDPQQAACATRPPRSRSTPRARSSTSRSPAPAASPPQDWPLERLRAIGKATGTTLNDVVLAMCSGAMRTYLDRARRAARHVAGRDGAGRPQGQEVPARLRRRRQRGRLGDGASSAPTWPTPPTGCRRSTTRWSTARRRSAR